MQNTPTPLVSIVIITYNSSTTIIETLDSIKKQTYKNIELIISDDCSKDNTVELAHKWIEINGKRFVRSILLESKTNTGVAPNANRGNKMATGEWIKNLAGDDTFEINAIEEYVKFCAKNNCNICCAKLNTFGEDEKANKANSLFLQRMYADLQLPTREKQYKTSLKRHLMPGPGIFIKKAFLEEIGGYNEKYPLTEEYDFELRVLDNTKFYFLDKALINWRIRPDSLCHKKNLVTVKDEIAFAFNVRLPRLLKSRMYLYAWDCYLQAFYWIKKDSKLGSLYKILLYALSPIRLFSRLRWFVKSF